MSARFILFSLMFLLTFSAHAVVDMKTANFADTWVDLAAPGSGFDLRVVRTYNSRTIYSGVFGFGWCADFETRLEITPESTLKVVECGAGAEITYVPKKFDNNKVDQTVAAIMAEIKKRNPKVYEKTGGDLKKDLKTDDFFREEFARRIGIKGSVNKDTVYYANGRQNENIVRTVEGYKRNIGDGTYQLFDDSGKLTAFYDKNGNSLKMVYDKARLTGIVDNNGRRLTITYDNNTKKIKKIAGPNNLVAEYVTKGEDLLEVTDADKKKHKYKYDDLHNLTQITMPNGKKKLLAYNADKDWVTSFTHEDGCLENYEYKVNAEDPRNHFWSNVTKTCGKEITNRSSYEFFLRARNDGSGTYLYRAKSDINGLVTDIVYHEVYGKPLVLIQGSVKTEFSYDNTGMVKTKFELGRNTHFQYKNACNKPSEVRIDYLEVPKADKKSDKKPAVARQVKTDFTYEDKKCNLLFAKNTDGQAVKLQYDNRGRIVQIEDQSKKVVKIKYEERFGKPEVVTRPGLGTLKIVYKPDGEIKKVDSTEGPRVAVQVASIFNNLLEIIAPAGVEANL